MAMTRTRRLSKRFVPAAGAGPAAVGLDGQRSEVFAEGGWPSIRVFLEMRGWSPLQIDQLQRWNRPIVLVARSGLGTLNHTLLSLEALNRRQLTVLGLILNGPAHADNPGTLEQFGGVPVLAHLPKLSPLTAESLAREWKRQGLSSKFQDLLGIQQP